MRDELVESKNMNEAEDLVRGLRFEKYEEGVSAVQYKGLPVCNPKKAENDPDRFPYEKVVNDVCRMYSLDDAVKQQLTNAKLAEESSLLNFDIRFKAGKDGTFYYGKFMAVNIEDDRLLLLILSVEFQDCAGHYRAHA